MKTPDQILTAIAQANNVTVEQIKGRSRKREIVDARKMAMATLRKMTRMSLHGIGGYIGKDHSTVVHAVISHEELMECDRHYSEIYRHAVCLMYPSQTKYILA